MKSMILVSNTSENKKKQGGAPHPEKIFYKYPNLNIKIKRQKIELMKINTQ
jgi:hypothetical protein